MIMENNNNIIYSLRDEPILGKVIKRPSKYCKTPYVADVEIVETHEMVIVHTPCLGCCGYVEPGEYIYIVPHPNPKTCTHVAYLAKRFEIKKIQSYNIGIHPKSAEEIVYNCLNNNYIPLLKNNIEIHREQVYLNSRFDFSGIDENNRPFILEVKSVPCGDYEDIDKTTKNKLQKKNKDLYIDWAYDSKISYFPDGYRKKKEDTISPRALKHIQELEQMKTKNKNMRCILVFVVQREDCYCFQASNIDPIYKSALKKAYHSGVEVYPIQVKWHSNGNCEFMKILPFRV